MSKKLFALLSVLMVASMLLAACGTAPVTTPAPAEENSEIQAPATYSPTTTAEPNHTCGLSTYQNPVVSCTGNIATTQINQDVDVYSLIEIVESDGGYSINIQIEETEGGNIVGPGQCLFGSTPFEDGKFNVEYPMGKTTEHVKVSCNFVSDQIGDKVELVYIMLPVHSALAKTLTAMPTVTGTPTMTQEPTATGTPNATSTPTKTQTPTATFTPAAQTKTAKTQTPATTGTTQSCATTKGNATEYSVPFAATKYNCQHMAENVGGALSAVFYNGNQDLVVLFYVDVAGKYAHYVINGKLLPYDYNCTVTNGDYTKEYVASPSETTKDINPSVDTTLTCDVDGEVFLTATVK